MSRFAGRSSQRIARAKEKLSSGFRLALPLPAPEPTVPPPEAVPARPQLAGWSRRKILETGLVIGTGALAGAAAPLLLRPERQREVLRLRLDETPPHVVAEREALDEPAWRDQGIKGPLVGERRLVLHNENTGETVRAVYWADGEYQLAGLEDIHRLLRDHHRDEMRAIDLKLIEALFGLQTRLEVTQPLQILSGYRSALTNAQLKKIFDGVATNSFHIKGKAVDLRVPGRGKRDLLRAALDLHAGGVGDYPGYVHLDTGPVRTWAKAA